MPLKGISIAKVIKNFLSYSFISDDFLTKDELF